MINNIGSENIYCVTSRLLFLCEVVSLGFSHNINYRMKKQILLYVSKFFGGLTVRVSSAIALLWKVGAMALILKWPAYSLFRNCLKTQLLAKWFRRKKVLQGASRPRTFLVLHKIRKLFSDAQENLSLHSQSTGIRRCKIALKYGY